MPLHVRGHLFENKVLALMPGKKTNIMRNDKIGKPR